MMQVDMNASDNFADKLGNAKVAVERKESLLTSVRAALKIAGWSDDDRANIEDARARTEANLKKATIGLEKIVSLAAGRESLFEKRNKAWEERQAAGIAVDAGTLDPDEARRRHDSLIIAISKHQHYSNLIDTGSTYAPAYLSAVLDRSAEGDYEHAKREARALAATMHDGYADSFARSHKRPGGTNAPPDLSARIGFFLVAICELAREVEDHKSLLEVARDNAARARKGT
jgi:hypothetical protein